MHDPKTYLASLRRPRLLVHAARHGAQDYRRNLCLRRLFPGEALPRPGCAFETLVEREAAMNHLRRDDAAQYSAVRHVELLVALIEEARLAARRLPRAA